MLSGLVCVHVIAAALSRLCTQGKWSWQFLNFVLGDPSTLPFFEKNLSSFSSAFDGHFLPHLLDVPDAVDPRSSLHLQQSCPHSPRELQWALLQLHWNLQTALSTGKERRPSTTGTGAGPEGNILIANVVLSMPKQRWMTIQMLIWFIQICNLKTDR